MDDKTETIKLLRDYPTHKSPYFFTKTDYFCMNCGAKNVWEDDCDDYYQGTNWVCFDCGSEWANPRGINKCHWFAQIKKYLSKESKDE